MQVKSNVKFLGKESKISKKTGNAYISLLLMQGSESFNCLSQVDLNAEFGQDFTGVFDLNVKFKTISLVGVEK